MSPLFSVAGPGQNIVGHIGTIASATGGFAFPLADGVENTFGHSIQIFGSRYLVQWAEEGTPSGPGSLEISTGRKGLRLLVQATR